MNQIVYSFDFEPITVIKIPPQEPTKDNSPPKNIEFVFTDSKGKQHTARLVWVPLLWGPQVKYVLCPYTPADETIIMKCEPKMLPGQTELYNYLLNIWKLYRKGGEQNA